MMKIASALIQCMIRTGNGCRRRSSTRFADAVTCSVRGIGNSCLTQSCHKAGGPEVLRQLAGFDDCARVLVPQRYERPAAAASHEGSQSRAAMDANEGISELRGRLSDSIRYSPRAI